MTNSTVGVKQATAPDRLIDNEELTVGGQVVQRQRVSVVPAMTSSYSAGVTGAVTVPVTHLIVEVTCVCVTAGSLVIAGGDSIPVPADCAFVLAMPEAPVPGIGANSVVFTGTASYFVRYVAAVA